VLQQGLKLHDSLFYQRNHQPLLQDLVLQDIDWKMVVVPNTIPSGEAVRCLIELMRFKMEIDPSILGLCTVVHTSVLFWVTQNQSIYHKMETSDHQWSAVLATTSRSTEAREVA
jgi:hypothetical protein